jgi:hypothetical protein
MNDNDDETKHKSQTKENTETKTINEPAAHQIIKQKQKKIQTIN